MWNCNDPINLLNRFSIMRGPRELLFFQLVVLLHRSNRYPNSCWAHRMFEISSHKVSSILSNSEAEFWINCPPNVPTQFTTTRWLGAGIWGFGSAIRVHCYATLLASGLPACFTNLHTRWRGKINLTGEIFVLDTCTAFSKKFEVCSWQHRASKSCYKYFFTVTAQRRFLTDSVIGPRYGHSKWAPNRSPERGILAVLAHYLLCMCVCVYACMCVCACVCAQE